MFPTVGGLNVVKEVETQSFLLSRDDNVINPWTLDFKVILSFTNMRICCFHLSYIILILTEYLWSSELNINKLKN